MFGGQGCGEQVGVWPLGLCLPLSSQAIKFSQASSSWDFLVFLLGCSLLSLFLWDSTIDLDLPGGGSQGMGVLVPLEGGRLTKVPSPVLNLRLVRTWVDKV